MSETTGPIAVWEKIYAEGKQLSSWPWSDAVTLVSRYISREQAKEGKRVLELGPGVGANIPFLLDRGFSYFGIEGSQSAVDILHQKFPALKETVSQGDFTKSLPFGGFFDGVVDRCSLPHNDHESVLRALRIISKRIAPGGHYFGIDWYSDEDPYSQSGDKVDHYTRTKFTDGPWAGSGPIHFVSEKTIEEMLCEVGLQIVFLEKKKREALFPPPPINSVHINFVAKKT